MSHSIRTGFRTIAGLLVQCLAAVAFTGCGTNDLVPVGGTVQYHGKPLDHGRVAFYPQDGRQAFGEIRDGHFTLTSYRPGDGAAVGTHRVTIHCDVPADPKDPFSDRVSLIPKRYLKPETSGLTAEVKPAGNNEFSFELTD
jgi:hypothetical protein